ncbi:MULTISPECIES: hypothetical protein [unclassified Streptomyces]|uniref:hypothetical protein n=1 Tax=unclassified Streptomyces TaxID=2593676 RepID=UPI00340A20E1
MAGRISSTASLHEVLSGQEVSAWAAKFLRPLAADPKDLLHTLRTWVLAEFDPDAAGAQLHVGAPCAGESGRPSR